MYFSTNTIDILVMPERFFILVLETNLQNLFSTSVHQKPSDLLRIVEMDNIICLFNYPSRSFVVD